MTSSILLTILALLAPQAHKTCLPTGACLDPAGRSFAVGNMPLAIAPTPEGDRFVVSLNGWREQGIQVIERETGAVVQTIPQSAAFFGIAFSPDGRTLYASGGNDDVVYRYDWRDRTATLRDRIVLAPKEPNHDGTRFPAGVAVSADGATLYVAENLADTIAVVDVATAQVVERHPAGVYPYGVALSPDGRVFVSAWGGDGVSVFTAGSNGRLTPRGQIRVGRHPSALLLSRDGSRLFVASASTNRVAVVDTRRSRVVATLADPPPAGPNEGSTPDALALSPDGSRLYVAEADNNAVAVFDLSRRAAGVATARGRDRLSGRIPAEWYPTGVLAIGDSLYVLNGKGMGTRPNPKEGHPGSGESEPHSYTLGQLDGTISVVPAKLGAADLRAYTERVARANNWTRSVARSGKYPPFKHVIYVIKENRTYDQVLSDLPAGDSDTSLLFFPRAVSPNHHALAERFGLFDRFFVNAEVSSQGHPWSTSAYVTDYSEKTVPSLYSDRRDGNERGDVDEPVSGFLWNAAIRRGVSLRNYGEYGEPAPAPKDAPPDAPVRYRATKKALDQFTNPDYPSFDMAIPDQRRMAIWLDEFRGYVKSGRLPAFEIMHLPCDHTAGARPGRHTPKAMMADNDLALGHMIEAVSNSPYWKDTVFFVLEDDAQDGPDHVDSHRSVLLVISAYNRGGLIHRFVNTTDVLATIEEILGLERLSQFDTFGHSLHELFGATPDLRPYVALTPEQSLDELNPAKGANAEASLQLDLDEVDAADMTAFNHVLWRAIKGDDTPYPDLKRASTLELTRGR